MKYFNNIKSCRICSHKKLKLILDLGNQPAANNLHKKNEIVKKAPLKLVVCNQCKTAQLSSTINPKYLFSKYLWVTGTSKGAKSYSKKFYNYCKKRIKANKFKVFEIACNDGTFLKPFEEANCSVLGIDPASNIVRNTKKKNIINDFFNFKKSQEIKKKFKEFDLVFARNVIPHVPNIKSVIKGISNLIEPKLGIGAIEFHYGSIIQKEIHYDSIYHEHYFYFTILTLSNLLKKYGLFSFDIEKSPISGGSLVIFFSKQNRTKSKILKSYEKKELQGKTNSIYKWSEFGNSSRNHSKKLKTIIENENKKNKSKLIAYGASARSSTLLNFLKISNKHISYILDKNNLKSSLYTPGTNLCIKKFDKLKFDFKSTKIILLLAWNFKKEIISEFKKNSYKGKFLIPLPKIKIIK